MGTGLNPEFKNTNNGFSPSPNSFREPHSCGWASLRDKEMAFHNSRASSFPDYQVPEERSQLPAPLPRKNTECHIPTQLPGREGGGMIDPAWVCLCPPPRLRAALLLPKEWR